MYSISQYIVINICCHCNQGWSGNRCDIYNHCRCYSGFVCIGRGRKNIKPICLCQLGRIDSQCYISYLSCKIYPCQNRGIYIPLDDKILYRRCICSEEYFGVHCEYHSSQINIVINQTIFKPSSSILLHLITLYENKSHEHRTYLKHIHLYQANLIVYHPRHFLPSMGFIEIFDNEKMKSNYYLSLLILIKPMKNEILFVKQDECCKHIRDYLMKQ